ncbi:hypothetical protein RUM43_003298 [Polyplax serrata]|uniref:Uncharacterized protein n=1 Tax=Polyplax serrata TaxID=468196 RepID=A0AAN8S9D2_POLSC
MASESSAGGDCFTAHSKRLLCGLSRDSLPHRFGSRTAAATTSDSSRDDDVMTYPKVTSSHGPDGCSVTVARISTDHSRPGLGLLNRIINVDFRKDESAPGRSQFSKRQ